MSFVMYKTIKFEAFTLDLNRHFSCSLQVETYGSMEKKEKAEFILEQMRLCIAVKDYIRTQIISKKINTKFFQDEGTEVFILFFRKLLFFARISDSFSVYNFCGKCVQFSHLHNHLLLLLVQDLKLKYYNLMIQVDLHEGSYLSICKHYRAIYDTPCILEDASKWQQVPCLVF